MSRYFYYPLPDLLDENGNYLEGHEPHSYVGHGPGKLDIWGNSTPIYAMCDGIITDSFIDTDGNIIMSQECTDNVLNKTFYIRYLHGIWDDNVKIGNYIKQGERLGITSTNNGKYDDHLHMDFSWVSNNFAPVVGSLNFDPTAVSSLPSNATFTCNNKTIPLKNVSPSILAKYYNENGDPSVKNGQWGYCWLIFSQQLQLLEPNNITVDSNLDRSVYENAKGSDDNADAVNFYFNGTISEDFMGGSMPTTIEELNSNIGLKRIIQSCKGEYRDWPFAAASYAKLYRATIIGNSLICDNVVRQATNLNEWLARAYSRHPGWMATGNTGDETYSEADLPLAQAIYNNLRYPALYGEELHTGSETFKQCIFKAVSGIPLFNGWVNNTWASPPVFAVLYNPNTDIDEGMNGTPRGGTYLMYRGKSGSIDFFNENVGTLPSNPTKLQNEIETINQNSLDLPTGCEITSLGMALNYKNKNGGYSLANLIKRLAGNTYLPQANKNGSFGPDPRVTFVGSPSSRSSYGCFASCITQTIENFKNNDSIQISYINTSGESLSNILKYISQNKPILAWVTSNNLHEPEYIDSWTINDSRSSHNGEHYTWPRYEHCVVIIGYDDNNIYVADPLSNNGKATYSRSTFEQRYNDLEKNSIVIG